MGKLTDTPIHRAIKRGFPQTNWPETAAIDLLEKYDDGAWIKRDGLSQSDLNIMIDLATAGIIESNRKPKFVMGQFAGFENSFRYKADLEYFEVEGKKSNSLGLKYAAQWVLAFTAMILTIAIISISIIYKWI